MPEQQKSPSVVTGHEAAVLLQIAREAVHQVVCSGAVKAVPDDLKQQTAEAAASCPGLQRKGAVFVTLTRRQDNDLRGCIGSLHARYPLWEDTVANAAAAAQRDPRFPPVREAELAGLQLELSVLGPAQELEYTGPEDLIARLRPGIDGVVLSLRGRRATFLPQVWTRLPRPEQFLGQLCHKAGLFSGAWRQEHPTIAVYQVQSIGPEPLVTSP
ncbi:AmmeMemoRadiSam system protein A [Spirochaeta africana]|uniref:Uncharacterized protein, PH0010 family n=1 Tax=Spirochaeta africana (strain ATCC 700263 / DSM 8902 / Z-7692) TaxID=889378 RepID=H9UFY5_SPIAZ|nr:AmmeMemoRadiSam system protein A [Spirochaeta africana]AFG36428.1 uncharacterized protein, PH0010 family [Spirochaeta africana DSM 8902]